MTPVRNPLYVTMADGAIRNTYALRLRNKQGEAREFTVQVLDDQGNPPQGVTVTLEGQPQARIPVAPDATQTQRLYLTADKGSPLAQGKQTELTLWVEDTTDGIRTHIGTVFHGGGE